MQSRSYSPAAYQPTCCPRGGAAWYPRLCTLASPHHPATALDFPPHCPCPATVGSVLAQKELLKPRGLFYPALSFSLAPKPSSTPSGALLIWGASHPSPLHCISPIQPAPQNRTVLCLPGNPRMQKSSWHRVGALYVLVNSNSLSSFLR